MKKSVCLLLVLLIAGWSTPSFAEGWVLELTAVTSIAGGGGVLGSAALPPLTTSSSTTSTGASLVFFSMNQAAPTPRKQSQALNDYLMLHREQFAMHVTVGAGESLTALMHMMKTPSPDHKKWFRALRRHRKSLLAVLSMPSGRQRGDALYHVLRQIHGSMQRG